jgi:hypothetical protein
MPEITSDTMPCCVTDISAGRIRWGWRQGHWVIAVKPDTSLAQKGRNASAADR